MPPLQMYCRFWMRLPAAQRNARYFLDVEIFQSVIELQREKTPASRVDDYVFALNYYLENDDFY